MTTVASGLVNDAERPQVRPAPRKARLVRALTVVLLAIVGASTAVWVVSTIRDREQTTRSTARFDPPVWAGQNVPGACSGGFYARRDTTIALTIVAHCANPGDSLRDPMGRLVGVFGPRAQFTDCPVGRFCAPSDFLAMALAPDRIPWGHLNVVDMGAGGYRTIEPGTRALGCGDMRVGDRVEIDGRERYRAGSVIANSPYRNDTDTMFPCMVVGDIQVVTGDSGGAVLVNGLPAGIISRQLGGLLGFTPLAEGLENLGLALCTTPDCDLSPDLVVQPGP
ncbi:MAG: hypothetical protein ABIZ52_08015 [Candidatus Limnocylindrales bacterium]